MGENTKIEWANHTFNAWIGCQEVSPACDNCYARVQNDRWQWVKGWGPHGERRRTSTTNWTKPRAWDKTAKRLGVRYRVFCSSLSDVFDNEVPPVWREELFALIRDTTNLDWLLLTKRPQNIERMLKAAVGDAWGVGWPNVWLGMTAENQAEYDRRVLSFFSVPAAVRFLSCEPLLGPINLGLAGTLPRDEFPGYQMAYDKLDWVICGGESAMGIHRPMGLAWARGLRDQCNEFGKAFFMKQIDKVQPIPADLMVRQFPVRA